MRRLPRLRCGGAKAWRVPRILPLASLAEPCSMLGQAMGEAEEAPLHAHAHALRGPKKNVGTSTSHYLYL